MNQRPPLPPFTEEGAVQKVRLAEDGWNTCSPEAVSLAYTIDAAMAQSRGVRYGPNRDRRAAHA